MSYLQPTLDLIAEVLAGAARARWTTGLRGS